MDIDATKISGKPEAFVRYLIDLCREDKGAAAALRRADNPTTEYQSWEFLVRFSVDLEKPYERISYAMIAAAIARSKPEKNGAMGIGKAIAFCYEERNESDQAKAKLRRLLACDSVDELSRILRPLFSLIDTRVVGVIDYAKLLRQLLRFNLDRNAIKTQWASDFYRQSTANAKEEEVK